MEKAGGNVRHAGLRCMKKNCLKDLKKKKNQGGSMIQKLEYTLTSIVSLPLTGLLSFTMWIQQPLLSALMWLKKNMEEAKGETINQKAEGIVMFMMSLPLLGLLILIMWIQKPLMAAIKLLTAHMKEIREAGV